jgi:signal transduction histidine kinase
VQAVIRETSALPAHLTDSLPNDSLVSIRITTAEGLPLAEYRLANTLPHRVERKLVSPPGLITTVSLSSGLSKRLVHGAPPGESVWIFGGMAGIAVILLAAAAVLWRQDRRLAHLREQFVAGVSHELRTPLAQIRLFAETLALGRVRDDREVQQAHRVLQQETQRLTHLVENLLVFSRQERDRLLLNRKAVDVSRLVAAIVEEFEPLAQAAHARIMTDIEPGIVAEVDRDAVRQIVLNLLDNAVKYGPDGQIITVRLSSSAERAVLTVEDEGVGVAPQHQARVWERFWRGPDAIRRGKGGSGIGLTVVRDLAEKHGGNAALEAGTSTGACFVVRLPLQLASE